VSTWTLLFLALGMALFLEGLPYLISPTLVRRYLQAIQTMGDGALRALGLALIAAGLLVAFVSTH
jgi:uncharacterized protein YjeT (DUF2065 family)